MALEVNSSERLSGRNPVVALNVRKVFATPVAVPVPPVVEVASPTRKGTIAVFCTAELMPVARPAVVPAVEGAVPLTKSRATLVVAAVFIPKFVPLIRLEPAPATCWKVGAVKVAVLVPPKEMVMTLFPPLIPPMVSAVLVATASEPLRMNVPPPSERVAASLMRALLFPPAAVVLSKVSVPPLRVMLPVLPKAPAPEKVRLPALTVVLDVKALVPLIVAFAPPTVKPLDPMVVIVPVLVSRKVPPVRFIRLGPLTVPVKVTVPLDWPN